MALSLPKACGALQFSRGRQDGAPLPVIKTTARNRHTNLSNVRPAQLTNFRAERMLPVRVFPFDQAWAPSVSAAVSYTNSMRWSDFDLPILSLAPQLFAMSLFPYLAFLYFLTKSGKTPRLTLIGFYFLLAFVGATIPAGIYAKSYYGTSLANVDWLHGAAESLLTVTNLLVVLGLRQGIREAEVAKKAGQEGQAQEAAGSADGADAASKPAGELLR